MVIALTAQGNDATRVDLTETPIAGPGKWLHNPVTEQLLTAATPNHWHDWPPSPNAKPARRINTATPGPIPPPVESAR